MYSPINHKVSPQSTDPVPLYSMYNKMQNVDSTQAWTYIWGPGLEDQPGLQDQLDFVVVAEKQLIGRFTFFSATKQDRVGSSLLSRNTLFTFCSLLYILYRGTGSVDQGDTLWGGGTKSRSSSWQKGQIWPNSLKPAFWCFPGFLQLPKMGTLGGAFGG